MVKFFKKIFSSENLKKAMVYASLANPNMSKSELVFLSKVLININEKNSNKEMQIKKAA